LTQDRRFDIHAEMDVKEFQQWFMPQPEIVNAYVTTDGLGQVTNFLRYA
jgi:citrate lyase synthetase